MWFDPQLLRQLARVSGVAFQGLAVLLLGIGAGLEVDHVAPWLGQTGLIIGALIGAAGSAYATIFGSRRIFEIGDSEGKEETKR